MDLAPKMLDRLAQLERHQQNIERRLHELYAQRRPETEQYQQVRLAVTCADPDASPSYPNPPANTFPIRFIDGSFANSAGYQTPDQAARRTDGKPHTHAINVADDYLAEGTLVVVIHSRPLASSSSVGEWWIERTVTSESIVRFRLTTDLALGGSASAKLLTWNGAGWTLGTATIAVFDWFNTTPQVVRTGQFRGKAGYEGWAVFRAAADPSETPTPRDKYDIVWLEHKALFVRFTLTAPITNQNTATAATYSGDTFFQGRDPNAGTGSGVISVYDVDLTFLNAPAGAEGLAVYNDTNDHYEIVYVQMPCLFGKATISGTMAGDNPTISGFEGIKIGHYMLDPDPLPTTAVNPCAHHGFTGDTVYLLNNSWEQEWTVIDVTKKVEQIVIDVQLDGLNLQKKVRSVAVEASSPPVEDWTTWLELVAQTFITSEQVTDTALQVKTREAKVIAPTAESGWTDIQTLTSQSVVTDEQVSGTALQVKRRTLKVLKADAESGWTTIHTGTTDCPAT